MNRKLKHRNPLQFAKCTLTNFKNRRRYFLYTLLIEISTLLYNANYCTECSVNRDYNWPDNFVSKKLQ